MLAGRVVDQTLGFLRLVAESPGESFSPSAMVDKGWHAFILYTKDYAQYCDKAAGRFIHHNPFDEEGVEYGTDNVMRTVAAMRSHDLHVDDPLWAPSDKADCDGTGCGASGACGGDGC